MPRLSVSVLLLSLFVPVVLLEAQTNPASDFIGSCPEFPPDEVLFIGRAGDSETHHIAGAVGLEEAQRNVDRALAAVEPLRAAFDPKNPWTPDSEAARELMAAERTFLVAQRDFDRRRAASVPPYDLTLVRMQVEQTLRGTLDPVVLVHSDVPFITFQTGERYVMRGRPSTNYLPYSIEMNRSVLGNITEYIEVTRAAPPEAVRRQLDVLSALKGGSVAGRLVMQAFGDGYAVKPSDFRGTRIVVSSGTQVLETVIAEDGHFFLTGLKPGRVEVRPILPADMTVTNRSATTVDVADGGCRWVHLTANLNGRVRGRVRIAATPLAPVKIVLQATSPDILRTLSPGQALTISGSSPVATSLKDDGAFELSGVPPGWYVLSASVPVMMDGKERRVVTYYPGTAQMSDATPIEVGKATVHEGFDFVVAAE